jgi:hypothetical protein
MMVPMVDAIGLERVRRQVGVLRELVAGLDPDEVALADAAGMWQTFDAIERLGAAGKVLLACRVDESGAWQQAGERSAAEYLAHRDGTSVTAARSVLATSNRLTELPETEAPLRRGDLSSQQAEAIADAASHNRDAEADLLGLAGRSSLAELRQECARAKARADKPESTDPSPPLLEAALHGIPRVQRPTSPRSLKIE